tara:strand:+ start:122 stop:397 length:276 start_codon:yes stop_codon:yes gene_type:complete
MAKKKKEDTNEIPEFDTSAIEESLKGLMDEILTLATDVVDEYKNLDLSELADVSGSVINIAENSPFLNEIFQGDAWKKVINQTTGSKSDDT